MVITKELRYSILPRPMGWSLLGPWSAIVAEIMETTEEKLSDRLSSASSIMAVERTIRPAASLITARHIFNTIPYRLQRMIVRLRSRLTTGFSTFNSHAPSIKKYRLKIFCKRIFKKIFCGKHILAQAGRADKPSCAFAGPVYEKGCAFAGPALLRSLPRFFGHLTSHPWARTRSSLTKAPVMKNAMIPEMTRPIR